MAEELPVSIEMEGSQAHPAQNGHAKPALDPEVQPLNGHAGTGEPPEDHRQQNQPGLHQGRFQHCQRVIRQFCGWQGHSGCFADWKQPKFSKKQAAFAGGLGGFLMLVLLFGNIYQAVPKSLLDSPAPPAVPCPKSWVRNEDWCYFFSNTYTNWTHSQNHCSSYGGSLVTMENPEEKGFIKEHLIDEHWIGLRRESQNQPWMRPDGSLFNNSFPIRGGGECAYVNGPVVSSTWCTNTRRWICSRPAY